MIDQAENQMLRYVRLTILCSAFGVLSLLSGPKFLHGQSAVPEQDEITSRYFEVLIRRPRPGTALDRIYSHHLQNRTLDEFLKSLDLEETATQAGEHQMVLGLIQLRRGQYSKAIESLGKAERWLENDAMASFHLGKALLAIGKTDEAARAMQRAIDRGPNRLESSEVFLELGRILARSGESDRAISVWSQLQTQFPGDQRIGERIATTMVDEKLFEPALVRYTELAETTRDPQQKILFQIEAAELQRDLKKFDEATKQLQSILTRLRPGSWLYRDVRDRLESVFLKDGAYGELADLYSTAIERSPDDLSLRVRLGQIQILAGHLDRAEKTLATAIQLAPDNIAARTAMIDVLDRRDDVAEASVHFDKLIQLEPNNPDYYIRWGRMLLSDGDTDLAQRRDAATDVWKRLLQTRPEDPVLIARMAKLLTTIEQSEQAIALFRRAIAVAPESPQYREYLGEYLYRLNRSDEAIEVWQSIATGPRRDRDSFVRVAEVLYQFRLYDLSLKAWRQASAFDLTFDQQLRYADALVISAAYEQAITQLEAAEKIAETDDERWRVLRNQISAYTSGGRLREKIADVAAQDPTTQNRILLALLYHADGQSSLASRTISAATTLDPDHVNALVVAAEIAEDQDRSLDAIKTYERLIEIDLRYRNQYLQRVIALHRRLGNSKQALKAAGDLIDVAPGSPDSYRIFAEIATQMGRNEEAVVALHNAIAIAPRDNVHRLMLAKHLAGQFQTDEAIELYWEAMQYERDWDGRHRLIGEMAALYERRGISDQLLRRIESFQGDSKDPLEARRLAASFWQVMGDYKQAGFILQRLSDERPDDTQLIRQTVACLISAKDYRAAVAYQSQLIDLDGSERELDLLTRLQLKLSKILPLELHQRQLAATRDPAIILSIIERAFGENPQHAVELCRIAVDRDPSLWGIKSVYAQLLMMIGDAEGIDSDRAASQVAAEIAALDLNDDVPPPSRKRHEMNQANAAAFYTMTFQSNSQPKKTQPAQSTFTLPKHELPAILGRMFGTVRTGSATMNATRTGPIRFHVPVDFNQARWFSYAIQVLVKCKQNNAAGKDQSVGEVIAELFPMPDPEDIEDPVALRRMMSFHHLEQSLAGRNDPPPESLLWRMADVEPIGEHPDLTSMLDLRINSIRKNTGGDLVGQIPLDTNKLRILTKVVSEHHKHRASGNDSAAQIVHGLNLYRYLITEYRYTGREHPRIVSNSTRLAATSFAQAIADIQIALWEQDISRADSLIPQLAEIARQDRHSHLVNQLIADPTLSWAFSPTSNDEISFIRRHRVALVDAWLAHCSRHATLLQTRATAEQFVDQYGEGQIETDIAMPSRTITGYIRLSLTTTLSKNLINSYVLDGLKQLVVHFDDTKITRESIKVSDECLAGLRRKIGGATSQEQKLRRLVVALANCWNNDPDQCYAELSAFCRDQPEDIDLQIETARFEFDQDALDQAIERLSQIETADQTSLIQIGLANTRLAHRNGMPYLARLSAKKILELDLDPPTRSAIASHLQGLGITVVAALNAGSSAGSSTATLGFFPQDDILQLRLAKSLFDSGNRITAAEIAFAIVKNQSQNKRIYQTSTRSQAIDILLRAGRIDQLIATTRRRLESPDPPQGLAEELAELYQIAGRSEQATQLWEREIDSEGLTPREILARADALRSDRKFHQAAITYLFAFEQDPELWHASWNAFIQSGEVSESKDAIYTRLLAIDVRSYSLFSICSAIGISTDDEFSEPRKAFTKHVIETHPDVPNKLSLLKRFIPESQHASFPRLVALLQNLAD